MTSSKPDRIRIGQLIARSIVDVHDGRIWADDPTEGGPPFSLALRMPTSAGNAPACRPERRRRRRGSGRGAQLNPRPR